jgi:hypothetical protein
MDEIQNPETKLGEGVRFDRVRRQESDVGFETVRSEYNPNENLISNSK